MLTHKTLPICPTLGVKFISRIRENADEFLSAELEKAGASGMVTSHGNILVCLYLNGSIPMFQLANLIGRRKSTLTVLVDKLEAAGYVQRETLESDSRVRHISLTEKGQSFQKVFIEISQRMNARLWQGFSMEEQQATMEFLQRLMLNMEGGSHEHSQQ